MLISHLKKIRLDHGMKQDELYKLTGIRPQTLHNIEENNIKQIPVEAVVKILKLYKLKIEDLFEYIPDEDDKE